jgi:hypothetical protein
MCMATQPASAEAATSQREAEMSFTRLAPAASAAFATSGLTVSTDRRTPLPLRLVAAARASMTGTTRSSSTAAGTGSAPGRDDSPPTSIRSAPASIIWSPRATADSGVT